MSDSAGNAIGFRLQLRQCDDSLRVGDPVEPRAHSKPTDESEDQGGEHGDRAYEHRAD
jgi:hypothetical protein